MPAAHYHLHASIGNRESGRKAGLRFDYVMRQGVFSEPGRCSEDFVMSESGNMPAWAEDEPGRYWNAADLFERGNAVVFREIEFAIPHGLSKAQRIEVARSVARSLAKTSDGLHPYTMALHAGTDSKNWNCHVMISERVNDGLDRDPETWFKRAAVVLRKKNETEKDFEKRLAALDRSTGGAKKTRLMQPKDWLLGVRKRWEEMGNQALAKAGRGERLDCRSLKEQGIDHRMPQIHLGRKAHRMLLRGADSRRAAIWKDIDRVNKWVVAAVQDDREAADLDARARARQEEWEKGYRAFLDRFGDQFRKRTVKTAEEYVAEVGPGLRGVGKNEEADLLEKYGPAEIRKMRKLRDERLAAREQRGKERGKELGRAPKERGR